MRLCDKEWVTNNQEQFIFSKPNLFVLDLYIIFLFYLIFKIRFITIFVFFNFYFLKDILLYFFVFVCW